MKKLIVGLILVLTVFNIVAPFKYRQILNCRTEKTDVYKHIDKMTKLKMDKCEQVECVYALIEQENKMLRELDEKYGDCL